jgi:predicted aspartyl protease
MAGLSIFGLDLAQIAVLAAMAAFIWLAIFTSRRYRKRLAARMAVSRQKVNELFRGTVVHAEDTRFAFDGGSATVIEDQESPGDDEGWCEYTLTRYARNPAGEYFMFMFEVVQGQPRLVFMKLVEQHIARFVLKEKYLPPPLP